MQTRPVVTALQFMLSVDTITGDLCPHRPPHAEFRVMSFWLKLGHTSSWGILLAKTPFIPAAVACLFAMVWEFACSVEEIV